MGRQFEDVSGRYGAPMGRRGYGQQPGAGLRVRLFRVRLDAGGYDDGGAYWGHGQPLYCATDGADYREFIRAGSRFAACAVLDLDPSMLAVPVRLPECYSVRRCTDRNGYTLPGGDQVYYWDEPIDRVFAVAPKNVQTTALQIALEHYRNRAHVRAVMSIRRESEGANHGC